MGLFRLLFTFHWVWDGGILAFGGVVEEGALNFAGGTFVHISSGVSSLGCCLFMGRRLSLGMDAMRPYNLAYTALGAEMLWVAWFGFKARSQLTSDGVAFGASIITRLLAPARAVSWTLMEWILHGKISIIGAASGAAAGSVNPMPALIVGVAAGVVCYLPCSKLKSGLGYDASLDAFGMHGVGRMLGTISGLVVVGAVQIDEPVRD